MAMPLADDDLPVTLEPEVVAMAKTHVDIEDTLLAQAMQVLGTSTKKETITRALRQVVEAKLAARSQHRAAGPADLLIAATAVEHDLVVLHDDRDFELLGEVCGVPHHPVVPLGSID